MWSLWKGFLKKKALLKLLETEYTSFYVSIYVEYIIERAHGKTSLIEKIACFKISADVCIGQLKNSISVK